MKYYTETIPATLAEKLKEKGMPLGNYVWLPNGMASRKEEANLAYYDDQLVPYCTYADVFDWFAEQGYYISIHSAETPLGVGFYPSFNHKNFRSVNTLSWHDAANAAIEKALTLI